MGWLKDCPLYSRVPYWKVKDSLLWVSWRGEMKVRSSIDEDADDISTMGLVVALLGC